MSPEICSTTVRIDRRRDDDEVTFSAMTTATAPVEEKRSGRPTNGPTGSPQLSATSIPVSNGSRCLEQTAALSPGLIDGSNASSKNRSPGLFQNDSKFNLTKIEFYRLTVRCLIRTISYEKSVFVYTTDLHEISCSNPRVMMSRRRHHHLNTGIWLVAASQRSADDPPATAVEELLKCTSIDDATKKRRLKTSDSQLSQSHSSIIYFILNWDRLLV